MRKFGTDSPVFFEFGLVGSDETYRLPLVAHLPLSTLAELKEAAEYGGSKLMSFQVELLRRYIGDVAGTLSAGTVGEIYSAWNEESAKAGASAGE